MGRSNSYSLPLCLDHSQYFQDKTMMARWGLQGMESFQHPAVVKRELDKMEGKDVAPILD